MTEHQSHHDTDPTVIIATPILDLTEDEPNLDWLSASYEVDSMPMPGGGWKLQHRLMGADSLAELFQNGDARWVVEVRCPTTLTVEMFMSAIGSDTTTVSISKSKIHGPIDLWPGLLTVRPCQLRTVGLSSLWTDEELIPVPSARWLARMSPLQPESGASLLAFREDESLHEGELRIAEDNSHGHPMFVVAHHPSQHSRTADDAFCVMAFSTALAMLGSSETFSLDDMDEQGEAKHEHRIVNELIHMLQQRNVPLWSESEWDPLRAATALLDLPPFTSEEDE